jgi:hypothetical protein
MVSREEKKLLKDIQDAILSIDEHPEGEGSFQNIPLFKDEINSLLNE